MILKSLSRKSGVGAIVRYVLQAEKLERPKSKAHHERPLYVPGVKFTAKDLLYLKRELEDAIMMREYKEHISRGGTLKEFMVQQMYGEKPGKENGALVITHNLRSKSVNGYIKEFEAINDLRIHTRSGQVKIYHEIMSWNAKDSHLLTDTHLRAMADKFIELRGKGNAYLVSKHADRGHVHLHFLISGTQMNGLSSRVSKQEYAKNIKLGMEKFQRTVLPELVNSLPAHGKKAAKEKGAEKLYKNDERLSVKNSLLKCLDETYSKSATKDHFFTQLKSQKIEPYERGGKLTGVIFNGYKFRLNRLDYTEEKLNFLDERKAKQEKALQEINNIRNKIRETGKTKDTQDKDGKYMFQSDTERALYELANLRESNSRNVIPNQRTGKDADDYKGRDISDSTNSRDDNDRDNEQEQDKDGGNDKDDRNTDKDSPDDEPDEQDNDSTDNDEGDDR